MGFKDIKYDIPIKCKIRKYTNTKCLKDPTCAIFLKSREFKDINYSNLKYTNKQIRKYKNKSA